MPNDVPERVWVSSTIAVSGLNKDYYLSNVNFHGDDVEFIRSDVAMQRAIEIVRELDYDTLASQAVYRDALKNPNAFKWLGDLIIAAIEKGTA